MSEKVVALPGAKIADGSIPQNVVRILEEVLEEAKAGRVAAVAIVYVSPHHGISQAWANNGLPTAHDMVAGCTYLLDSVKTDAKRL